MSAEPGSSGTASDDAQVSTEYAAAGDRFRRAALDHRRPAREVGPAVDSSWLPRLRRPSWPMPRSRGTGSAGGPSPGPPAGGGRAGPRGLARRRIPVRIQSQISDCGPVCLGIVLAYHGVDVGIDQLREETNAGRDGVSARVLLETARRYGVPGRGVRATIGDLQRLPPGSILFWNFTHFVVLDHASAGYVHVVDPALGRRRLSTQAASDAFTGVALEFQRPLAEARPLRKPLRSAIAASPWRYLRHFVARERAWRPLTAASLLLLLFNFVTPLASAYVVERTHFGRPGHQVPQFLVGVLALTVVFFLLQLTRGLAIVALQTAADKKVTLGVLYHLLSLPYDFFVRRNAGDLAMRVRTSLDVRRVLASSALSTIFDGLLILVYGALLVLADAELALLIGALAVLQVGVLAVSWRGQQYSMANALDCQSQSESELVELLDGISTLKAAGLDGAAGERWSHTFAAEVNARLHSGRHFVLYSGVSASLQFTAPLAVLVVGAIQVGQRAASLGAVIAFSLLAMGLFIPLTNLVLTGMQVAGLGRTLARLGDILEAAPEDRALGAAPPGEITGKVEAREVDFAYPGSTAKVLHKVSMSVQPGSFVAILGPSGCGKSTLAGLLVGLYVPTSGHVLIDDLATDQVDRGALRRSMSFVNQDARLFAGTIHDNIAVGERDASTEDIVAAAELAGIDQDVRALPMGYQTLLGPGGGGLSGGQRQRIVLARALVRRPRLLVLDEATSALDPQTEERIFARLLELDCTLIVIAHHIAAAASASAIFVIEAGRVVQSGTHRQLVSAAGPYRLSMKGWS